MRKFKADIVGQMAKPKEGWEERTAKLAKPENFTVTIYALGIRDELTEEERRRLAAKAILVCEFAKCMMAGMLKGVLKYKQDDYPTEQWLAHLVGEGADLANYIALLADGITSGRDKHRRIAAQCADEGGQARP